ncbi:phosphocholine-specific phospholipase C [Parapedobacter sp.]
MDTRREFLKNAMLLTGGIAFSETLCASILKAAQIDPAHNSTFADAEHIVFLMQENRSFDHMFGSLQGVRGFNDPRAIRLPNGNRVWLQSDEKGDTYAPFHLDINNTKVTWMGDLPHGWPDQTDARNHGHYDQWLLAKKSGRAEYRHMPLTLGYYGRADLPFYYAMADAFTVCDQNFCSALSSTTPNRIHFWSGTLRDRADETRFANVWNGDAKPWNLRSWKTFPERLQEHGISWKVYQNDLYKQGLPPEKEAWLDNFGDNTLENFAQYRVDAFQNEKYASLSAEEKAIHDRAFCTNRGDANYRELTTYTYTEGGETRQIDIPKGDVLYQFRQDVQQGKLSTVSWLVPAGKYSDHPGHPWYGQWYMSEVINILTKNPEVWKKTIFILTYDENDGYFDHIPPYVPPHPGRHDNGKLSASLDAQAEYVTSMAQQSDQKNGRLGPIGLGYRVPMIIASPWTRGGWVNSQVFDHTSSLRFLESFVERKYGKKIKEDNISDWRRTVCGDLTSAFRKFDRSAEKPLKFLERIPFIEQIDRARYKSELSSYRKLSDAEITTINAGKRAPGMPRQEDGIRPSTALPYAPEVNGSMRDDGRFEMQFHVSDKLFGKNTVGSPFIVYAYGLGPGVEAAPRNYAVTAGDSLVDAWDARHFASGQYHFTVQGPNGFFREFKGDSQWSGFRVSVSHDPQRIRSTGKPCLLLTVAGDGQPGATCTVAHEAYSTNVQQMALTKKGDTFRLNFDDSHGWYDFTVRLKSGSHEVSYRFAGRVETGRSTYSDPLMGGQAKKNEA